MALVSVGKYGSRLTFSVLTSRAKLEKKGKEMTDDRDDLCAAAGCRSVSMHYSRLALYCYTIEC